MFKYNNTHIFTGYLKQLLSSFNLPACKIYTHDFTKYLERHGKEDPRILESFDASASHAAARVSYLKNDELYNYFCDTDTKSCKWKRGAEIFYSPDKTLHGLTRSLRSLGNSYDTTTHEYLGDYLRFLRDYYNLNLMSMYNCFNNKIYNNIYCNITLKPAVVNADGEVLEPAIRSTFDSQDPTYRLYAIPAKLFSEYTIAIDCSQGIELFCGLYNTRLDVSSKASTLAAKTYMKINKTMFNQPFVYDKLTLASWPKSNDFKTTSVSGALQIDQLRDDVFTHWDIANREKDLRIIIKVPTSCKSSIVILEGNYKGFNDFKYLPAKKTLEGNLAVEKTAWNYDYNHCVLNFSTNRKSAGGDGIDLNEYDFSPISRLQLLAVNTGESYPFADRLLEYLVGSAITSTEEINDNIKRVQRVMEQNEHYFKIEGLWENKMQNIIYDYIINSGPIVVDTITIGDDKNDMVNYGKKIDPLTYTYNYTTKQILVDKRNGTHPRLGHTSKSTMYDILGYVDKDTEKLYSSWRKDGGRATVKNTIQNVDIYDGLYDI